MEFEWVVAQYVGEKARTARAHAKHGVGYYIIGNDTDETLVTVAFKRPKVGERPSHLLPITDQQEIRKLERRSNPLDRGDSNETV